MSLKLLGKKKKTSLFCARTIRDPSTSVLGIYMVSLCSCPGSPNCETCVQNSSPTWGRWFGMTSNTECVLTFILGQHMWCDSWLRCNFRSPSGIQPQTPAVGCSARRGVSSSRKNIGGTGESMGAASAARSSYLEHVGLTADKWQHEWLWFIFRFLDLE